MIVNPIQNRIVRFQEHFLNVCRILTKILFKKDEIIIFLKGTMKPLSPIRHCYSVFYCDPFVTQCEGDPCVILVDPLVIPVCSDPCVITLCSDPRVITLCPHLTEVTPEGGSSLPVGHSAVLRSSSRLGHVPGPLLALLSHGLYPDVTRWLDILKLLSDICLFYGKDFVFINKFCNVT